MPRYFLDIRDRNVGLIADPEGEEVEDIDAIRRIAEETIEDIMSRPQVYGGNRIWRHRAIEIVDEAGSLVLVLPFAPSRDPS